MNQLNSIILEGNITRPAELSEPTKGFKVCKFPVAVNRYTKTMDGETKEEVSYFDIEAYGKMAESCAKYCDRGTGVRVVGRLKQNRWEDEAGTRKSKVFVVAEHLEYRFSKNDKNAERNSKKEISNEAFTDLKPVETSPEIKKEDATEESVF